MLDAAGERFTQEKAEKLSQENHLILIAGHYEGVDHRVHEHIADEIISIGDYVLSGGEIPVMVVVDSIVRLLPGALGHPESLKDESFNQVQSPFDFAQGKPESGDREPGAARKTLGACSRLPTRSASSTHSGAGSLVRRATSATNCRRGMRSAPSDIR